MGPLRFKSSAVWVGTRSGIGVYRSLDQVPAGLRTRIRRSLDSDHSFTILIADKRGRQELVKALAEPGKRNVSAPKPACTKRQVLPLALLCLMAIAVLALLVR